MTVVIVDTNVLLDVVTNDAKWAEWSLHQMETASRGRRLVINAVVFAELSIGFKRIEEVDDVLADAGIDVIDIPRAALFLAGKAFVQYRGRGGVRSGVLPDFFIGAHAVVESVPLLTRDAARYRTYFPGLHLIAPAP